MQQLVQVQGIGLVGEVFDRKSCFENRDIYFQCLDNENLVEPNPFKCEISHQNWSNVCNPAWMRAQVAERVRIARDHKNYTQEALNDYNRRMNQKQYLYEKKAF